MYCAFNTWIWVQGCLASLLMTWMTGQRAPSGLQMIQSWEGWVTHQVVVLPSRGPSIGWRTGRTGTSCDSSKGSAKPCTGGGTAPSTSTGWGRPAGKYVGRKGPGGPGGHKLNLQYALAAKVAGSIVGCVRQSVATKSREVILFSPLLGTGALCAGLGSPVQERYGHIGQSPAKGHRGD